MAGARERLGQVRGLPPALLAGALALALAGCGGSGSRTTAAALKLERDDLAAACRALRSAEPAVGNEVAATKVAWPLIANGVRGDAARISAAAPVRAAIAAAAQLRPPALFEHARARSLAGPAAGLAGLFRSYVLLSSRGWKLVGFSLGQIQGGASGAATAAGARFAAENVGLYIESIYDAHFTLAQLGKKLLAAYDKLGGERAFGASLTRAEVHALAATYSEARDRLHPHDAVRLGS
jgi:hypothetical protein